jgi:hypothetical protein
MINDQIRHRMLLRVILLSLFISPSMLHAKSFELKGKSFKFIPKLSVTGLYDTNVFYEAPVEPNGSIPNTGFFTKVASGFAVENRHKNKINFTLGLDAAYRHYFDIDDENGRIKQGAIDARNTLDFAKGNARLIIGTHSDLQLELSDQFTYTERPVYENTLFGYERIDNRVGAAVSFAPGSKVGSRGPLELKLNYKLQNIKFLNDNNGIIIQGRSEKVAHITRFVTRWRFLPKNFLLFDVSYTSNDYNDFQAEEGEEIDKEDLSRDSSPFRAQVGLSGLLSRRIAVFIKGGYANTFNSNGASFNGFVGIFQVTYQYLPRLSLSIGYQRDGQDSGFSNYYVLNRYFLKSNIHLGRDIHFVSTLSYDEYSYVADNAVEDQNRFDPVLRSDLKLNFPLISALKLQVAWNFEANYTEYKLPINVPVNELTDYAHYQRHLFSIALLFN